MIFCFPKKLSVFKKSQNFKMLVQKGQIGKPVV